MTATNYHEQMNYLIIFIYYHRNVANQNYQMKEEIG